MYSLSAQQQPDQGGLIIRTLTAFSNRPLAGAHVRISSIEDSAFQPIELTTDNSGQTEEVELPAPPLPYSLEPGTTRPYSNYRVDITADNYEPLTIDGVEIFSDSNSIQTSALRPLDSPPYPEDPIIIPEHTLYEEYPPKIAESEIKRNSEGGEIVLSRVVIPETIVVHDGTPTNSSAPNYYVPYRDYIKNVASSEIYSTWNEAAIRANVLAIMSFTLNRVYTEWYRNKGYDFTITSSTAYDQKWIYGRNIYDRISDIVDEIFTAYLSRPNVKQPIFTQYCDGSRVTCPNWLSQWGSQQLAENGYSAIEILRYYYGSSIYINTAEEISGIPFSWPGSNLDIGSSGQKVYQLQEQLNTIAANYPAIPTVAVDGIYGEGTQEAVRTFQSVFGLPATGITDYNTWFKISEIFVGVSKIAELA
ncbi:MAG: peptidoglycan-binding protein [Clostridiales bacterium]|nr:peptidoglycan-binding protein [Clostridiales bacterium]